MSSNDPRPFPILLYLSVILMLGPMLAVGLLWGGLVLQNYVGGGEPGTLKDPGMKWLAIAVAAAGVGLLSEWLVLPLVIGRGSHRPRFTPVLSLIAGLAVAVACFAVMTRVI
ncbi:MAG: hypothetical protein JSR45_12400 [Proteobacteria bacterium]|nr:hypothetical protein [Pseudomonadota bacterium]